MRCQTESSPLRVRGRDSPLELPQLALEALGEASGDPLLLFGALLRITVQPHLASVLIHHLVQMNLVVRPGLDGDGPLGVEATGALAADHQITVAVVTQPGHVVLGGNPRIHHHQGVGGRVQGLEHRLQRLVFVDPAGKHFGAAHETRTVQHQPQGQQRTVAALLFRVPPLCLGLVFGLAFEKRVGEVVQRHRVTQPEQLRHLLEQVLLDGLPMRHQRIRDTVKTHQAHGLEVHLQQLPQPATLAQPAPTRPLRPRLRHPPDDRPHRHRPLPAVEPQTLQQPP